MGGQRRHFKHVMSGVNPQGCQVFAFKKPSSEDNFIWLEMKALPERGRTGIFNRSDDEDAIVVRVIRRFSVRRRARIAAAGKIATTRSTGSSGTSRATAR